jgi:hypothetical protein
MATITSRVEFKQYCLRRLGAPVLQINVDDSQIEDRIDDAFQYYQDYHYDAIEKCYWKHTITQLDVDNQFFTVDPGITGITRIFPINDTISQNNMFDLRYQLRLHELYDFSSSSYSNFNITMQHLKNLEEMFTGEIPILFQRHTGKLIPMWAWGAQEAPVGMTIVAEGYRILDPEVYTHVYNDRWLREYATALIKRQWAYSLKKFSGVQLPGGITLDGQTLYNEAEGEILKLEAEMMDKYSLPVEFMIG